MGDAVELGADGIVDLGDAVAVDVAPETADAVEIFSAIGINQIHSGGIGDDQGWLGEPGFHVGERVPEMLMVEAAKIG
jgi:hypothetical protein